jgi:hypothetical protein
MKKFVLSIAVLLGATAMYAQSTRTVSASQDPATATAIVETNKLKDLKLTAAQDEAIYKLNLESARAFYVSSNPGSVDKAVIERNKAKQDMEYKKILTKEQYATWKNGQVK